MDNYYDPYERLNLYLSCLGSEVDYEKLGCNTVARLAEIMDVPVEIVRRDIVAMARYKKDYPVDIDYEDENWEEYCQTKQIDEEESLYSSEELVEAFLRGELDDIPLELYSGQSGTFLSLSIDELAALQVLQRQDLDKKAKVSKGSFLIKNSYRFQTDMSILDKLKKILDIIYYGRGIRTQYVSQNGQKRLIEFVPLRVMYDSFSSIYAALAVQDGRVQVYRLDRMQGELEEYKVKVNQGDLKYLEHADQVWGMGFSEQPVRVKVAFRNEANVWRKVELETAYRSKAKITRDEEIGWLYFEDEVYGMSAFRGWLYGYGSSAVVLEPKELRDDIIAMLKERLEKNKI